jgi:hypothetical protein
MYQDSLKLKNFGVNFIETRNSVSSKDSSMLIHIGGQMKFDGLMLNARKGSFLKDKDVQADLNIELSPTREHITITPRHLAFENRP